MYVQTDQLYPANLMGDISMFNTVTHSDQREKLQTQMSRTVFYRNALFQDHEDNCKN